MTIRRNMMLMEAAQLRALILEAREDGLIKRFVPIIVKNLPALAVQIPGARQEIMAYYGKYMSEQEAEKQFGDLNPNDRLAAAKGASTAMAIILFVLDHDPDPKKSFSTWMVTMFTKKLFNLEDMPRVVDALTLYSDAKKANHIPRSHDLGTVKSLDDLYDLVAPFKAEAGTEIVDRTYEAQMYQEAEVLIDSADYKMIVPKTQEAAQWFGRHTEWCTAWGGRYSANHSTRNCMWYSYAPRGPLYIIQRKADGALWQFQRESQSYMDVNDRSIDLPTFVRENPEIAAYFVRMDVQGEPVAKIRYEDGGTYTMNLFDDGDGRITSRQGVGLGSKTSDFSLNYDEDQCIRGCRVGYEEKKAFKGNKDFVDFLNSRFNADNVNLSSTTSNGYRSELADLIDCEISYAKGKGFGRVRDIADKVWAMDDEEGDGQLSWMKVSDEEYRLYRTRSEDDEAGEDQTLYMKTRFRRTTDSKGQLVQNDLVIDFDRTMRSYDPAIDPFHPFCALLKLFNDPTMGIDFDTDITNPMRGHEGEDLYLEIVKQYPESETLKRSWAVNGPTTRMRKRVHDVVINTISGAAKQWVEDGDAFAVMLFDNVEDAVEAIGNDTAKWVSKSLSGEGDHQDYDGDCEDSNRRDFFDTLTDTQKQQLCAWIIEEAGLDEDDYSDHDWTDSDDFITLFDDADQVSEVEDAFTSAMETGNRYGAESEMSKSLERAISDSSLRFMGDDGKYSVKTHQYDTKCAMFVKYEDFIEYIDADEYDSEVMSNASDFLTENDEDYAIKVESPYYGYSGYDESSANERFEECLIEAGIIKRAKKVA